MMRPLTFLVLATFCLGAAAGVIGFDRRVPFSRGADRAPFLFSDAETSRIRNTVGYVFCPGAIDLQNGYGSTGFLIGTATDTYVVTAVHAFVDAAGMPREPLSGCTFQSFGLSAEKIPLVFNRKRGKTYSFGTLDWQNDLGNDLAIVRLSRPSPDAQPFSLAEATASLEGLDDQHLFAVSAAMRGINFGSDLILQNCAVRKFFAPNAKRPGVAYTDCAAHVGASGSPVFTRVGGRLVPVGLIQGSPDVDGLPYDEATRNYTLVIGLDGATLTARARELMGVSF